MNVPNSEKPLGRDAVKKALIQAATRLISIHGIEGVSIRQIAQEANVNHGLISRHFGTKEALITEVANTLAKDLFDAVRQESNDLASILERGFSVYSESIRALIRIIIDTETQSKSIIREDLQTEIFNWIHGHEMKVGIQDTSDTAVRLYLITVLVLGGELVGPSVQKSLQLNDSEFDDLRKRAYRLLFNRS